MGLGRRQRYRGSGDADDSRAAVWNSGLSSWPKGSKVGLVWLGAPVATEGQRYTPLEVARGTLWTLAPEMSGEDHVLALRQAPRLQYLCCR